MSKPVIALVGRPNVGKSTLFNKLTGKRASIVDDTAGVTRDRVYGTCEWCGREITVIDTGGIEVNNKNSDIITQEIKAQAEIAIDLADVVVFVVDLKTGLMPTDYDICNILKRTSKNIILCVNKCDNIGTEEDYNFYEFYNLGIEHIFKVSSVHGHGTGDLLDEIFKYLPEETQNIQEKNEISVCIIGKPNVGKSSLVNFLSGDNRSIVSNVAGTTRDAIDINISNKHGDYVFIDTAGIRKKNKITDRIEKYSIIRAKMAIEKSDVCLIMIDATEGATEQDTKIAGLAHEAGKASIIIVNKWDLISKDNNTYQEYKRKIKEKFLFMSYAPIMFISVETGQRVSEIYENINKVNEFNSMRISTGTLNDVLAQAMTKTPTPTHKGKKLKIYYMTQVSTKPPTFVFFVNKAELFHFSYQNYLKNTLRDVFGFTGTPLHFIIREKSEQKFTPQI